MVAVFPANLHVATDSQAFIGAGISLRALQLLFSLQVVLILCVWKSGKRVDE